MGTLGEIFGRTCRGGKKSGRKSSEIEIRFAVCKVERRTNSYQYVPTPFKYKNRHRVIFVQTSKVIREDFGFRILRCVIGRKKKLVPCYEPIRRPRFPALLVCLCFFFLRLLIGSWWKPFLWQPVVNTLVNYKPL